MNHKSKLFGIVVVIFGRGAQRALKNYPTIFEYLAQNHVPVVVVDHGGHDYLEASFIHPGITYLKQENMGFGAGVNAGCRVLFQYCDYCAVLNPDLDFDVAELQRLSQSFVAPFYVLETLEHQKKHAILYYSCITGVTKDRPVFGGLPYFNGAAFVMSRSVFELTGGFDEHFFLYFEDVDFSLQLARRNIKIEVLKTQSFIHEVGGSRTKDMGQFIQKAGAISALKFVRKWFSWNLWLYCRYSLKWLLADFRG